MLIFLGKLLQFTWLENNVNPSVVEQPAFPKQLDGLSIFD
jgi:hypothetical protein